MAASECRTTTGDIVILVRDGSRPRETLTRTVSDIRYGEISEGGEKPILSHPGGLEQFFEEWDAGTYGIHDLGRRHGIEFLE